MLVRGVNVNTSFGTAKQVGLRTVVMTRHQQKVRGSFSRFKGYSKANPTKHSTQTLTISSGHKQQRYESSQFHGLLGTDHRKYRQDPVRMAWEPEDHLSVPNAPLNTNSDLIKAKSPSGNASGVCPPSPLLSPYTERRAEEAANKQWGVDSYGSMTGILKFRDSDDQHCSAESRTDMLSQGSPIDVDLSRFELVHPASVSSGSSNSSIAQLEKQSATLREQVSCLEQELSSLKRRMTVLEAASTSSLRLCSGEYSIA